MEDLIEIKPTLIEKSNKMSCFIIFSLETNNCDEEIMLTVPLGCKVSGKVIWNLMLDTQISIA